MKENKFNSYKKHLDENHEGDNNNKKQEKKKTMSWTFTLFIIMICAIIIIPVITIKYQPMKQYAKSIFNNRENAIGYLQYFGSLVGGISTLIAVFITFKQTQKQVYIANINGLIKDYKQILEGVNKNLYEFKRIEFDSLDAETLNKLEKLGDDIVLIASNYLNEEFAREMTWIMDNYTSLLIQNVEFIKKTKEGKNTEKNIELINELRKSNIISLVKIVKILKHDILLLYQERNQYVSIDKII